MELAGMSYTGLEDLWESTFEAWRLAADRACALAETLSGLPYPSAQYLAVRDQVDVLIAAGNEGRELCEQIRAEQARRGPAALESELAGR